MSLPFSISLPVYNGQNYLEETIKSLLSQTFDDFELIIGNDGSTDNTSEIIHDYAIQDKRIVVIDRKYNMGMYQTLNQLQSIARGDYIASSAHDDISEPTRLQETYNYFQENPDIDACGFFIQMFGKLDRVKKFPLDHNNIKYIHMPFFGIGTSPLNMKREVMEKFSYRYEYGVAGDSELLGRILLESNFKVATIPKILLHFREHDSNASSPYSEVINGLSLRVHYISRLYRVPVDPIIDYVLNNSYNVTSDILLKAQNAVLNMAQQLDDHYSKQMGVNMGVLFKQNFKFLLNHKTTHENTQKEHIDFSA